MALPSVARCEPCCMHITAKTDTSLSTSELPPYRMWLLLSRTKSSESRTRRLLYFPCFPDPTEWFTSGQKQKALRLAGRLMPALFIQGTSQTSVCFPTTLLGTQGKPLSYSICHTWVHKSGIWSGRNRPEGTKFSGASSGSRYTKKGSF
jgi:hypothetical protein